METEQDTPTLCAWIGLAGEEVVGISAVVVLIAVDRAVGVGAGMVLVTVVAGEETIDS